MPKARNRVHLSSKTKPRGAQQERTAFCCHALPLGSIAVVASAKDLSYACSWIVWVRLNTSTKTRASSTDDSTPRRAAFVTTHWSVVLAAGGKDTTRARDALARLCQSYWYPLYAYVRRRGYSAHDAQDLTQAFFECLLERQSLANVDPSRGRFRSFILGAMNHFLAREWEKLRAQK